jgi:mRNA interferase MazF
MKRGEVWRVRFPTVPGHTQAGERPAVIMQNEPFLSKLPTVQIVPFTSQQAATRFPGTLVVRPDGSNGLTVPSVALVFQLAAQDKRNVLNRLGELSAADLERIAELLQQLIL